MRAVRRVGPEPNPHAAKDKGLSGEWVFFRLAVPTQAVRAHANIESEQGTWSCPVRISRSSSDGDDQALRDRYMSMRSNCGQYVGIFALLIKFVRRAVHSGERCGLFIVLLPTGGLRRAAGRCACMQRVRQGGMGARAAGRPCASSLSFNGVMQADKCSRTGW